MKNDFCLRTSGIWQFAGYALFAIKILIPIVIIIFGMLDFFKAIMSSDDNAIKKASASLIKRLIAGVVIFFIPTVVTVILGFIEDTSESLEAMKECETCLLDPTSDECDRYTDAAQDLIKQNEADDR